METVTKKKSCNFTKAEIEVLVNEVDINKETVRKIKHAVDS